MMKIGIHKSYIKPDYWGEREAGLLLKYWGASGPLAPLVPTPLLHIKDSSIIFSGVGLNRRDNIGAM